MVATTPIPAIQARDSSDGVKLVVDPMTLGMMSGSKVDFVEDLVGSYFSITNPHATSQCGCGASFAI